MIVWWFFVVFFLYAQALVRIWFGGRVTGMRPVALLALDYVTVALFALYSLGIGSFRRTEGLDVLDFENIGINLAISILGMGAPAPAAIGYLALVAFVIPPLFCSRVRVVGFGMVALPWMVLLLLSLTVKSVFMYRTLGLFLPFLAIAVGVFLSDIWARHTSRGRLLLPCAVLVLAAFALNSSVQFEKEGYRDIAAIWDSEAEPDALLIVDRAINLWGVSRYLPGTPHYSALDVQPPVRDGMLRLKTKLAGSPLDKIGFFGRADHLEVGARQIWPWPNLEVLTAARGYWLLDPLDGVCLNENHSQVQRFVASGKTLIQCQ